jgi:hypothetical protein
VHTTVRAILGNESYVGKWTYGSRQWRKLPGTNKRRPQDRDASMVLRQDRPALRIIDDDTWNAVVARLAGVRARYTKDPGGVPKGRAVSGKATSYPFSGLLFCGVCGAPMVISGGSSKQYYRCSDRVKRGTCTNSLSVPEDVTRASLLEELRHRLASPMGIAYARKRFAERLGELERTRKVDTAGYRHLDMLEGQIAKLVDFIAEGGASSAVAQRLKGLEAEADGERRKLAEMKQLAAAPIELPTPEKMLRTVFDLEQRLRTDVVKARTELARLFRGGRILLMPQPGGFYIAKSETFRSPF